MACPYHHKRWRGVTQSLLNQLRGKVIPNNHVKNFSRAVCVCKEKKEAASVKVCSVEELKEWVHGPCKSDPSLKEVQPSLLSIFKSVESTSCDPDTREGLIRALSVIKAASGGDYSSLERPKAEQDVTKPGPLKVEMELPISSTNLGVFFGSNGKHIKPLCSKHNVAIHFTSDSVSRSSYQRKTYIWGESVKVSMEYLPGSGVDVEAVKKLLKERAKLVAEQRKKHAENLKAWWQIRARRRLQQQESRHGLHNPSIKENPKEAATSKFARKHHHAKKRNSPSGSDQDSTEASGDQTGKKQAHHKPKILSDGHCLNCMASYEPKQTNKGACTYHCGYLVPVKPGKENKGYSWTCCKRRTAAQHPTHELHARTGCTNGRHTWRPGKSSSKGGTVNKGVVGSSDFYVK